MNDLEILKKRVLKLIDEYGSIKTRNVSEENFKDARLIGYKDVVHIIDTMLKSKFKPGDRIRDKSSSDQKIYTVTEFITDGIAFVDEYGERFTKYFDEDDWDVYELVTDSDKQQEYDKLEEVKSEIERYKTEASERLTRPVERSMRRIAKDKAWVDLCHKLISFINNKGKRV